MSSEFHSQNSLGQHWLTGIEGLDTVLGRGMFVPANGQYPSLIFSGPPGAGKSIVALSIAASFAAAGSSALVVLSEEKPADFAGIVERLHLHSQRIQVVKDNDFTKTASEAGLKSLGQGKILLSFYPEAAIEAYAGLIRHDVPANPTLHQHIIDRVTAMGPHCKVVIIDSLWAAGRIESQPRILNSRDNESSRPPSSSFERQRADFKELCEISSVAQLFLFTIIENDGDNAPDWREFVSDIVIRFYVEQSSKHRFRRYIRAVKTRYQESLDGLHALELTGTGPEVYPNGFALLDVRQKKTDRFGDAISSTEDSTFGVSGQFSVDADFGRFLDKGIAEGSAILVYGDDQTRKRLTAVRFLEQAFEPNSPYIAMVVCLGTDARAFRRVLRNYWKGDPKAIDRQVKLVESASDEPSAEFYVGELVSRIDNLIRLSGGTIRRIVVDDVAAVQNWIEYVPPLKRLFASYQITSLFVHTLEKEEQHQHRVMFDTIIRTKRFTSWKGVDKPFVAYHKTKENSVSPEDKSWWLFDLIGRDIHLNQLERSYLSRNGELKEASE